MSDHVEHHIAELYARHAHLAGMIERMFRQGKVTDVDYSDATKPRIRQEIGKDAEGQPVKGPWQPHTQHAGDRMIHTPLSVGQTVLSISPDGNFESAVAIPYGFSSKVKSPSTEKDTHVDQLGKTKNTIKDGSWKQEVEGASIEMTKGKIVLTVGGATVTITDGKIVAKADTVTLDGNTNLGGEGGKSVGIQLSQDTHGDLLVGNLATKVKAV